MILREFIRDRRGIFVNLKIKRILGISAGLLAAILIWYCGHLNGIQGPKTETVKNVSDVATENSEYLYETENLDEEMAAYEMTETVTEEPDEDTESAEKEIDIVAEAQNKVAAMSLEQKVAQLFVVTPEALTGSGSVTAAGETTRMALREYPVGGLIYFEQNVQTKEQVCKMTAGQQQYSRESIGLPLFISIDEEGGKVARIANDSQITESHFPSMSEIAQMPDAQDEAANVGSTIGSYLKELGFNLDFAPVADVLTNPENTVVKQRSFGSDPQKVSELSLLVCQNLEAQGVYGCYKHFPGHGATAGDTHKGFSYTDKTLDELKQEELIPFEAAVAEGCSFIMVGHISVPEVTGNDVPASLSEKVVTDLLRNEMQYDGLIITDAMNMGAIANQYNSAEAAVMAVQAGDDLILMPKDFKTAYQGVLDAVRNGTISEERIDTSVTRIVTKKLEMEQMGE